MNKLEKVFLALRTNIFNVPDEHITLKYYKEVNFGRILTEADDLEPYVPTEIKIDGFANYRSGQMFYEVAMVNRFDNPHLWVHTTFPHITLRSSNGPLSNATFVPEIYGTVHEIIDQIHLGKKVKGKLRWFPISQYLASGMSISQIRQSFDTIMEAA